MSIEDLERAKEIQRKLHEFSKSMNIFDKMLEPSYFGSKLVAVTFVPGGYINEVRNGHSLSVEQEQVNAFLVSRKYRLVRRIKELNKELEKL